MSGFEERYQVCCPECCGSVEFYPNKAAALSQAISHAQSDSCKDTYVFDRMAQQGCPDFFRPDGKPMAYKPYRREAR